MSNAHQVNTAPVITAVTSKEARAKIAEQAKAASQVAASDRAVKKSDNFKLSPAGEQLMEFLTTKIKEEGISSKLLLAMYQMEVTFSQDWCHEFYTMEAGADRIKRIRDTLADLLGPAFFDIDEQAEQNIGEATQMLSGAKKDSETKRLTEMKEDAQRKRKTLENIMRSCILALSGLYLMNATKLAITKNGKLVFSYKDSDNDVVKSVPNSFNSMCKNGEHQIRDKKWSTSKRAARPGTNAATATAAAAIRAASLLSTTEYLIHNLKDANFDALTDREAATIRALEKLIIAKHFGDEHGNVSGKDVGEYFDGSCDYRDELPKPMTAAEASVPSKVAPATAEQKAA